MPGQSKAAPQPEAVQMASEARTADEPIDQPDPLEDHYGIILTDGNALARKYGCSIQEVYDVFNDFIQNAYDQQMYWTFLDISQCDWIPPTELPSWIECNKRPSRCIPDNNLTAGPDLHLFIIGGDDVIPIPRVEDPWPYGGERIPTDTCYAFEGTYIVDLLDSRDSDFTVGCARNNVARLPLEDSELDTDIRSDIGAYFNISGMYGGGIPVGNVLIIEQPRLDSSQLHDDPAPAAYYQCRRSWTHPQRNVYQSEAADRRFGKPQHLLQVSGQGRYADVQSSWCRCRGYVRIL